MPAQSHLRVAVLGRVRCSVAGREIDLGPGRQRTVFAVLAANAGRLVGRDDLIAAVWGPAAPPTAAGSIYTYISGLRRRLPGTDTLVSGPSGYGLRVRAEDVDAERFRRLRDAAAELIAAGDRRAAVARLDEALHLWHGDAYAGLAGPFIELDRQRLADLRLAAMELRARTLLELDGDPDLVAELTSLVRAHPLHEPLHDLLMRALDRSGRSAEALEAFRTARRVLVAELGVEPGPALRETQRRILAGEDTRPGAPAAGRPRAATAVLPTPVARAVRDGLASRACFGRGEELAHLREQMAAVASGTGGVVWLEGEAGIGKTELLIQAFADAAGAGCRVAWGAADELGQRVPLQVIARAMGSGPIDDADRMLAQVRSACATGPMVLVIDDAQWADAATVQVLERLLGAVDRLPLLLVVAVRMGPHPAGLDRLRQGVRARPGRFVGLRPLGPADIELIIAGVVGGPLGVNLRALAARAAGNPLYAREMVDALVRRDAVRAVRGMSDVDAAVEADPPESVFAAVRASIDALSTRARAVLRQAALLGMEFAVADVVALTGRSPLELMADLEEALAANVLVDSGADLAFRHPFLRQALHDDTPAARRAEAHRRAAQILAAAGGPVVAVAGQLAAAPPEVDGWLVAWLVDHHAEVARRMPQAAGDLIRRVLDSALPDACQRAVLLPALVRLEVRHDRYPVELGERAIEVAADPGERAEMRQLVATMRFRLGDLDGAIRLLRTALQVPDEPQMWRTRHRVLLANFRRGDLTDLARTERDADAMLAEATTAGERYEAAFALQTVWLTSSIRRDHERALHHVDRALDLMREDTHTAGMYADLLDNRVFSLQNLDRLAEAQQTLREARMPVATAVQCYWLGRWDEAMSEAAAGVTVEGLREPEAMSMLLHGVAALIALRRRAPDLVSAHLNAADALPASESERESCDFLLVARALAVAERDRPHEALRLMDPLLRPDYAPMMLRHQWLPAVVRLALEAGRPDVAEEADAICAAEAAREKVAARAHASALRCRALLTADPGPAMAAAAHYRAVGRPVELAEALEDAALLAVSRNPGDAADPGREAVDIFERIGAARDAARVRWRLSEAGVHFAGIRPRPADSTPASPRNVRF
ncbi:BTAD domain-containing putative transcriptional regulator [Mangrovihabitans endophyticus]|uniref:SARP family transcriptional regulator n=1 Tax=Mangrovihabitans endophyticus TaxID=1751298 RepID=A0A8J3FQG5_9ACTN|nr:BTAD domain-containing putative transcriptional regulator [Mangrovihabitans endophyticus]GGK98150.1 SARP family transcriptional regulator [Mangrovihabitans endophyticus]